MVMEPAIGAPPMESTEVTPTNDDQDMIVGLSKNTQQPADFVAVIGELDKELEDNAPTSNPLDARVETLIDRENDLWKCELVRQVFLPHEADVTCASNCWGCYQPSGLSSFDCRLLVPLLSVSRFYFGAKGALVEFWKELVLVLYV
nr:hypothetical protein CFP56_05398 [Quercus suber]